MLIVKITPAWLDTSGFLLILIIFWWLCRLCGTSMKALTICEHDPCRCDFVGRITCICNDTQQELEISRDGATPLPYITGSLLIRNCTRVRVKRKAFEELKSLERVSIFNVANLTLEQHSFSWNDSAIYETYANVGLRIHVENATIASLPTYVFRGRVDAVAFVRVRFDVVRSYAFTSLAGTKTVEFRDCEFALVEDQAFKKFAVDELLAFVGGRFLTPLPSRALTDVSVKNELRVHGVAFERVHSGAFRLHGPRTTHINNCRFARVDGEAFVVHTRGPVLIDDNHFGAVETGAFVGLTVERHTVEMAGPQELIFENNTIAVARKASLLFDVNAFTPKLDWIYLDAKCECRALTDWLTEMIVFSHRYPYDRVAPDVKLDEIVSCRRPASGRGAGAADPYVRLKDFSAGYCDERTQPLHMYAIAGLAIALALIACAVAYWLWYKSRKAKWTNVPQSSPAHETRRAAAATAVDVDDYEDDRQPFYEEPSTSRRQTATAPPVSIVQNGTGRRRKETELQVIVECTEPMRTRTTVVPATMSRAAHEYANRFRERNHIYSNQYIELSKEYESRRPSSRHQLLTSDL